MLANWISDNAGRIPDKTAIRFSGRDISYAGFAAMIGRITAALAASGVRRGDCVSFLGFNSPEMLALLFSCARLGALFMPLNWRLAAPEHKQMLRDCPPKVLIVEPDFIAQTNSIGDALAGIRLIAFGATAPDWMPWDKFLGDATTPVQHDPAVGEDAPLLICYTSGSTGKPKGVLLSQRAIVCNAANSEHMHDLNGDDVILNTLPLFHVGGLNNLTTPALQAG
jgi:fatty-acyl-CoA synthase